MLFRMTTEPVLMVFRTRRVLGQTEKLDFQFSQVLKSCVEDIFHMPLGKQKHVIKRLLVNPILSMPER